MAEYIDREAAYDYSTLECWYQDSLLNPNSPPVWTNEHLEELLNDFYLIPKDTPIADVVKVKHGEWNRHEDFEHCWYECSNCGGEPLRSIWGVTCFTEYCPYCGAKMDGGKNGK